MVRSKRNSNSSFREIKRFSNKFKPFDLHYASNGQSQGSVNLQNVVSDSSSQDKMSFTEPGKFYFKNASKEVKINVRHLKDDDSNNLNLFDLKARFSNEFDVKDKMDVHAFEIDFRRFFGNNGDSGGNRDYLRNIRDAFDYKSKRAFEDVEKRYNLDPVLECLCRKINKLDAVIVKKSIRNMQIKDEQQKLRNEINELKNFPFY